MMKGRIIRETGVAVVVVVMMTVVMGVEKVGGVWCVARSGASEEELQSALDYACAAGADCNPIQGDQGLCFLPNTLQAHASYAFNSFFQRSHASPSSCDFSGTATIAQTDPSYGSCVYPASPSTAGSITSTSGGMPTSTSASPVTPTTTTTPTNMDGSASGSGSGLNPNTMGPPIPTTTDSRATLRVSATANTLVFGMSLFLLLSLLPVF